MDVSRTKIVQSSKAKSNEPVLTSVKLGTNNNMSTSTAKRTSLKNADDVPKPIVRNNAYLVNFKSIEAWFYPQQSIEDIKSPIFWRDVFVEMVLCMYIMACVIWALTTLNPASYSPSTTHFGLFAGFFVFLLIEGYGPICGAPINPAGCWGFFLAGRMSFARMFFYTAAEIGGCAAGSAIGFALNPLAQQEKFGAIKPGPGLTAPQGMAIEAILTFNLLFVALSCTDPKSKMAIMPAFPIAFCIGTGIMAAGTHTGGLQNPIVPFGPAIVSKDFEHHWLYWAGPYIGATVGSLFYQAVQLFKVVVDNHNHHTEEQLGMHNPAHVDHMEDDTES